jgi:5'-phosphate synthase pdxT subunit
MVLQGGQALLSSMDVKVHRNYFGSQVGSFEAPVAICEAYQAQLGGNSSLPGVFIRAPAVLAVGKGVEVVATVRAARASAHRAPGITAAAADTLAASGAAMATAGEAAASGTAESVASDVIVAAVKGNHRLVTAFHPELTASRDWHEMFIQMVEAANKETATASS